MSVLSEANRTAELTTDGVETDFDFSMLIHAESELLVFYKATGGSYSQLTLNTHYTVEFGEAGGTITTIGGSSPYAAGSIVIIRHLPITQQTNWLYNDNHTEQTHQDDFDRAVMRDLQIQEELDRSPKFPVHSSTKDITFPEPAAGESIRWNSAGDDLINASPDAPSLHAADHLTAGADPLEIRAQDGDDVKPTGEADGYISVYKSGATIRVYTFVDGVRYYADLTADPEAVPGVGNPIGLLLALTYPA
jgi:hypothetical protein